MRLLSPLVAVALIVASPASRAAGGEKQPASLAYLELMTPAQTAEMAHFFNLNLWRNEGYNLFFGFNKFRAELQAKLELKAKLPRESLSALPEPELNRMALTLLRKHTDILSFTGETMAFMGKYLMDGAVVQWKELDAMGTSSGEMDEFKQAMAEVPQKDRRYQMNCAQFMRYSAHMAGIPKNPNARMAATHPSFKKIIDPSIIGLKDYAGVWMAYVNAVEPAHFKSLGLSPGDLIVRYTYQEQAGYGDWEFNHVEMVVRPDGESPSNTLSIGNSGSGPHYTQLFNPARVGYFDWMMWDRFIPGDGIRNADWRYVIYRFNQNQRMRETLDLSSLP